MIKQFEFCIEKPGNITATLAKVAAEVKKEKGIFEGDEKKGTIKSSSDVEGNYIVGDKITIFVTNNSKYPNFLVQIDIENTFKKCRVD